MAKAVKKVVRVRVTPHVDQLVADRLDVLAKQLGWTRNEVAEWCLIASTSNPVWLAKQLAAKFLSIGKGHEMIAQDNKAESSGAA